MLTSGFHTQVHTCLCTSHTCAQTQMNTYAYTTHIQIRKVFYKRSEINRKHSWLNKLNIDLILSWKFLFLKQTLFPVALEVEKNLYNQHQSITLSVQYYFYRLFQAYLKKNTL